MLDFPVISTSSYAQSRPVPQPCFEFPLITQGDSNPKKRSASLHNANDEIEPAVVQADCVTSLVDAVLRLSIEERPWRLRPGIRVKNNSIISRLSDISPALWSPGYLQVFTSDHEITDQSLQPNRKSQLVRHFSQQLPMLFLTRYTPMRNHRH